MLRWLLDNKEWLFSGAGIVGLVFLFQLVSRYRKRRKLPRPPVQEQSLAAIIEGPPGKPREIKKEVEVGSLSGHAILTSIKGAPILQRPDVLKNYIGLRVAWDGRLVSAKKTSINNIRLQIIVEEGSKFYSAFVEVDPSQYPGLGLLKYHHPVRVSGVISEINDYFTLKDARIEYEISSLMGGVMFEGKEVKGMEDKPKKQEKPLFYFPKRGRTKEQNEILLKMLKGVDVDKSGADYEELVKEGFMEEGKLTTKGKVIAKQVLKQK